MSQQPYGQQYPQGGWGGPPAQQAAPVAPPRTEEDFFDGVGEQGAPSFAFQGINDGVAGEIVSQYSTVVTDTSGNVKTYPPKAGQPGQPIPQLNVTLQTQFRNWDHVKKVPTHKNPDGTDGAPLDPSEDTGLRRIYIKYDMRRAVGQALREAGERNLRNGGILRVKLTGTKPTGQANPLPLYAAQYEAPAPSSGFDFGNEQQAAPPQQAPVQHYQQAAAQGAQQAAQQGDPWASQPQAAPAASDPWATQAQPQQNDDPPF